jgi:hypothetical protein
MQTNPTDPNEQLNRRRAGATDPGPCTHLWIPVAQLRKLPTFGVPVD